MTDRNEDGHCEETATAATLLIKTGSREIRRDLGALAWCCLEELSLVARRTADGWIAPVGVRAIGASLGVTKDTAARAVQVLVAAGLVRRCGAASSAEYGLYLPDCMDICLDVQDARSRHPEEDTIAVERSPDSDREDDCPALRDEASASASTARVRGGVTPGSPATPARPQERRGGRQSHTRAVAQNAGQASLFDDSGDEHCEVCGQRVPEWPVGWLRTDDGRNYCPDHKGESRFRS